MSKKKKQKKTMYIIYYHYLHEKSILCSLYLVLRILPVTSQSPDPGLSLGNEEWEAFVLSVVLLTQEDNRIKLKYM